MSAKLQRLYVRWTDDYVNEKAEYGSKDTSVGVELGGVAAWSVEGEYLHVTRAARPVDNENEEDIFGKLRCEIDVVIPMRDVARIVAVDGNIPSGLADKVMFALD